MTVNFSIWVAILRNRTVSGDFDLLKSKLGGYAPEWVAMLRNRTVPEGYFGGKIVILGGFAPEISTVSKPPKLGGHAPEHPNLLADWRLTLLDRTQDKVSSSGVYAESCKNPDLHVKQKRGKSEVDYYIECKYRSKWDDKGAVSLEEWQIQRYREFQRNSHRKVLIALGVGGTPSSPATFMVVPVDSIKSAAIRRIDTHFALPSTSEGLVSYIDDYFTTVFKKGSARKSSSDSRP